MRIIFNNVMLKLYIVLFMPISIPIILIIELVEKKILIRFSEIQADRIGHLAGHMELKFLESREFDFDGVQTLDIYYLVSRISNKTLFKLWSRKIFILNKYIAYPIAYMCFKILDDKHKIIPICGDRDILNLLDKHPISLGFSDKELNYGELCLKD